MTLYSILIIKTGALGDVIRATFMLCGLKKKYGDCSISWLTSERAKELLLNNRFIDKVYTIEHKEELPIFFNLVISLDDEREAAEIATNLRKDILIGSFVKDNIVTYTENSSPWFGMGLLRSKSRGGLEEANRLKKENKKTVHEILAEIAGIKYNKEMPILNLTEKNVKFGKEFAKEHEIKDSDLVIGINTGAGRRWQQKSWSVENTAKLIDLLAKNLNAKIILLGGKEEKKRNKKIMFLAKSKVIDSGTNNSLMQFAAIINLCKLLVTSDTMAMYMAIGLKKRLVVLIGPTSITEIELYGFGEKLFAGMPCLCCYKKKCDVKPNCMDLISINTVYEATLRNLNEN